MKNFIQHLNKPNCISGRLVLTALTILAGLIIMPVAAQINFSQNYIYISGQITNDTNGAPISNHHVYIFSDSLVNPGLHYIALVKTDVNGFYQDTIVTTLENGVITIYIYDFTGKLQKHDNYFRFNWSDEYQVIDNFVIHDPNPPDGLQANFKSETDTISMNEMSVIFHDLTSIYKIETWFWDFGDSSFSNCQNPVHVYEKPGIYTVSFTVNAFPVSVESIHSSTIVKQVDVGLREYNHLGGHVFTGLYPPIDAGLAYLYQVTNDDEFIPIDTAVIDTLGYYYFYQLIEGKYTTKVRLDESSAYYGQYIPTYLGNVLSWEQAESVILDKTNWECDINLIESVGIPYGKGQIVGEMLYDTSMNNNPVVPADDIEIVLLGVEGAHITCKVSDFFGSFVFSDLAFGTYQLYPDVAGVLTSVMFISISEDKPVAEDFSLVISDQQVTYLGITDPETSIAKVSSLYPNPAKDRMRLDIEMKESLTVKILVTDRAGRIVKSLSRSLARGNNELTLDVSDLLAGFYQVVISAEGQYGFSGKFVKTN